MKELTRDELLARRLIAQGLAPSAVRPPLTSALDVAEHLLALQGQTYNAGVRALSLRAECDEYLLGYANKEWIIPDEIRNDVLTKNGLSWPWVMEGGRGVASLR